LNKSDASLQPLAARLIEMKRCHEDAGSSSADLLSLLAARERSNQVNHNGVD
jgi:hypothetical protein